MFQVYYLQNSFLLHLRCRIADEENEVAFWQCLKVGAHSSKAEGRLCCICIIYYTAEKVPNSVSGKQLKEGTVAVAYWYEVGISSSVKGACTF